MRPAFRHRQFRPFSRLPGFSKSRGHFVPERVSGPAVQWARALLAEEIEAELQQVYQNAKDVLGLRHGQVKKTVGQEESLVESADFRFSIRLAQNRHDPGELEVVRQVQWLKEAPDFPPGFDNVFPYAPDEAAFELGETSFDELVLRFEAMREEKGGRLRDDESAGTILYEHAALKVAIDCLEGLMLVQPTGVSGCLPLWRLMDTLGFLAEEKK